MRVSKSGLFLFELIVVIFLFTVSSAVCISIFAKSYSFSTDSESLTMSSVKAETAAEVFKKNDGDAGSDAEAIAEALGADPATMDVILGEDSSSYGDFTLNLYYDKDWNNTDEVNREYTLTVTAQNGNSLKTGDVIFADIKTTDGKKDIFDMQARKIVGIK